MIRLCFLALCLMVGRHVHGEAIRLNKVLVTAEKRREPLKNHFQNTQMTKIILDDSYVAESKNLVDRLREIPGVDVNSGSSVFLRGGKSSDSLVVLDGIPLNDPSSPNRQFDFNDLTDGLLESVEVIQGSQTVLYGSNAVGGVLALKTKSPFRQRQAQASYETGSLQLQKENLMGGYGDSKAGGLINLQHLRQGEGHIYNRARKIRQSDDVHSQDMAAKGALKPYQDVKMTAYASQASNEMKLNEYVNGNYRESQNSTLRRKTQLTYVNFEAKPWEKTTVQMILSDSGSRTKSYSQGSSTTSSGDRKRISIYAVKKFNRFGELTVGGDHETEFMENFGQPNRLQEFKGIYLHHALPLFDKLMLKAGARVDHHQHWKSEINYTGSVSYQFPTTLLFLNYGTGFRAPSLIELYGQDGGGWKQLSNTRLMPERSKSVDVGFVQAFPQEKVEVKVVFFYLRIDHIIRLRQLNGIDFISENIHRRDSKGIEFSTKWEISPEWKVKTYWTETQAVDSDGDHTSIQALKIAGHKGRVSIIHKLSADVNIFGSLQYTGKTGDFGGSIKEYVDVTGGLHYKPTQRISGFLRLENMLNQKEERVLGFANRRFSIYAGIRVKV